MVNLPLFIHLQYQEGGSKKKEGDLRKADEAEYFYRSWVTEANARQRDLENTKSNILVELRQLVYQCDQTMKAVSPSQFIYLTYFPSPRAVLGEY